MLGEVDSILSDSEVIVSDVVHDVCEDHSMISPAMESRKAKRMSKVEEEERKAEERRTRRRKSETRRLREEEKFPL
tara:strand:+ start:95 stop:322 length:228 start_codon:yes stop_codon:yes gene_type:complete